MKVKPGTIGLDQGHGAEPGATAVIGLLLDIDGPNRFRIGGLERGKKGAIRSVAAGGSEFCEVVRIRLDEHDLFAIDNRAWQVAAQTLG